MPRSFQSFLPRGFRAQLVCAFVLLGALLSLSLSAVLGALLARKSERDASAALHTVVHNASQLLAEGLHLRLREVQVLAASPTLWQEGIAAPRVGQALLRSQATHPHSAWIGVADPRGVVRVATGQMLVGQDVGQRPWFQAGLQGPHVGDVHPAKLLAGLLPPGSDGGPQRFVDFAAPVLRQGRVVGVLGIHGSWDWTRATIESLLPAAERRAGLEVFVFGRDGQLLYAPASGLQALQAAGQRNPMPPAAARAQDDVRALRWADGGDYLTAGVRLPARDAVSDLGWTVVARQPLDAAYAEAREGASTALLVGLLATACAAVLGAWLAGRLTQPLRRIAGDALAAQSAPEPTELPPRSGNTEVEHLSLALNGMTRRLLQANAELEARVAERTQALEQANAALARLAHHDTLTGLLNRRGFDARMAALVSSARRRGAPLSLLLLDADHFKQVNDHFGHAAGDVVLQTIGATLRKRLREVDLVARIGGEEFVVVLADTGSLGASHVAAALVDAVRCTPMPGVGHVTISCGVAEMQVHLEGPDAVLQRADDAMYTAKRSGRDRWCLAADACVDADTGDRAEVAEAVPH
ncbi:sensor domain-containing diguanylate cyclase [Rubrivivax sp. RP6-9]|uniref:sensor domain-containing diguanylate cyclase n=1 Tax=Rubrivivax sp. RP6-9 TaxID=3415750 RepID=UPI003CC57523